MDSRLAREGRGFRGGWTLAESLCVWGDFGGDAREKCPGSRSTAGEGWADAASAGVGAMLLSLFGGNRGGSQAQRYDERRGKE